ncbi:MAG: macro domain-containing protein [Anaerolineae bacterium]|nr:macro domain-containing protein [Anaerolineae bacterium]
MLKLTLIDQNSLVCSAFETHFEAFDNIEVVNDKFENLDRYDCMVSPANSFGLMDGGIDGAIIRYFGDALMKHVQERILEDYFGEQPVGTSIIVETGHTKHPFLAHTHTMRIPMSVDKTDHVYLAMFAMLRAVAHHNRTAAHQIDIVACPGLGTATGQVPAEEAARQMALALDSFLHPPTSVSEMNWRYATRRQGLVRYGGSWFKG